MKVREWMIGRADIFTLYTTQLGGDDTDGYDQLLHDQHVSVTKDYYH